MDKLPENMNQSTSALFRSAINQFTHQGQEDVEG